MFKSLLALLFPNHFTCSFHLFQHDWDKWQQHTMRITDHNKAWVRTMYYQTRNCKRCNYQQMTKVIRHNH